MKLDPFYPIFDSADWIARMLPLGIKLVQLRMKDQPETEIAGEIVRAKRLCAEAGCVLVVNDYWKLAIEEGCDWLHLGQEDLDTADLGAIRKAGLKLGVSSHDEAELERALATQPDYVALGPVYPTILKQMRFGPQGLERLTDWKRRIGALPLVGIGGISLERAEGVFESGADIVAAVTDITLNADPEGRLKAWVAATRKHAA
ncbi:MAG: thiamine phosphate synthase [Bosea sp.]|uniref:thiamine phosphate synthase n=1 Tax=unclassified Bosea (in: a-proteobacteria) TaxID=2653178 RepID=UPI000960B0E1|nr:MULTISPECIES: thiamine phosphate synthase [unclassified Bosea (in: a-proteobacteria)]MBN9456485.1 thiamine phosphate synthase [Bosea sp. (in: a-proteobacteria)]OJV08734.1 MAG: thiamine-phosphate diphosphorylase [Bosea sp. 67-29]